MKRFPPWRKLGRSVVLIFVIVTVCVLVSRGVSDFFTIRTVEISGEGIQISVDQDRLPHNLLFFPAKQVSEQLLKDHPFVGSVIFRKKYPGTLVIEAKLRIPLALVGKNSQPYAVDAEGVIVDQNAGNTGLPVVRIDLTQAKPGDTVSDAAVVSAIAFLRETASFIRISEIATSSSTSLIAKNGPMSILFPQRTDLTALGHTLQIMIAGFRIKGRMPTVIDMRFDKPVVTF